MGKRASKRQKTDKASAKNVQPLGTQNVVSLLDDSSKDDEERRLESLLFGTKYVPAVSSEHVLVLSDDEKDDEEVGGGNEFQAVLDSDLFFVDDATVLPPSIDLDVDIPEEGGSDESATDEESASGDDDESGQSTDDEDEETVPEADAAIPAHGRKAPAWADPDDSNITISLASDKRLRKLRDAVAEDAVGGREYERRLRRQFEKINPTPDWAKKARSQPSKTKRRRSSLSSEDDGEEKTEVSELLASTGGILGTRRKTLPQGILSIERLRDANISARAEGGIKAVQFHPSTHVPVLLTASEDRRLRLFNVDGHTNPHLQTVHIPDLPITTAMFHPSGNNILMTGPRPFFYTVDLQSGAAQRSPRGLWGTTFNGNEMKDGSMEICSFDPTGEVLAVAGRRGYVHLVDWRSGTGQVVGSLKMNSGVKDVWWSRGSGGRGPELMSLGEDSEVYVWDIGERKCAKRWKDEGGHGSQIIGGDSAGQYLAIGSRHGVVNVYGTDATSSSGSERPKALKSIGNLTTSITAMKFNHDSQLLAIASNTKKDQMRMVHLPSLTAFSNWPTSGTPLGHITSIDFSTGSEYVAVGNSRGRVLLYHLQDFAS